MGIPKFFRWLSERYPLINQNVTEEATMPEVRIRLTCAWDRSRPFVRRSGAAPNHARVP
jgi:5'-3' exonuclease